MSKISNQDKKRITTLLMAGMNDTAIQKATMIPRDKIAIIRKTGMKKVVVMSDLHCGHVTGLTHPDCKGMEEWHGVQDEAWNAFDAILKGIGHIDVAIFNGDLTDGKGGRNSGKELITTDMQTQAMMAVKVIDHINADKVLITRGTPYHVGDDTDWEDMIGREVSADAVKDHLWFSVNGVRFNCKHKIGGTSAPQGKATPILKEKLWEYLWERRDPNQATDILIRSHVHNYTHVGGTGWWGCTTPALQGWTGYGARQCVGTVDWGLLSFDCWDGGLWNKYEHIKQLDSQRVKVLEY